MDVRVASRGGAGMPVQTQFTRSCRSEDLVIGESERVSIAEVGDDGGASSSCASVLSSGFDGGVVLRDPQDLIAGLLGCGLTTAEAAGVASSYYGAVQVAPSVESSLASRSVVSEKRALRTKKWEHNMSTMPYVEGFCYLHPVRWGRRNLFKKKLGADPKLRDFIAMLEPNDLHEEAAKAYGLYRISTVQRGSGVVYHVATECPEGVYVGSVWDCVADLIRTFPEINGVFPVMSEVDVAIPLLGTVGSLPAAAKVRDSPVITATVSAAEGAPSAVGNVEVDCMRGSEPVLVVERPFWQVRTVDSELVPTAVQTFINPDQLIIRNEEPIMHDDLVRPLSGACSDRVVCDGGPCVGPMQLLFDGDPGSVVSAGLAVAMLCDSPMTFEGAMGVFPVGTAGLLDPAGLSGECFVTTKSGVLFVDRGPGEVYVGSIKLHAEALEVDRMMFILPAGVEVFRTCDDDRGSTNVGLAEFRAVDGYTVLCERLSGKWADLSCWAEPAGVGVPLTRDILLVNITGISSMVGVPVSEIARVPGTYDVDSDSSVAVVITGRVGVKVHGACTIEGCLSFVGSSTFGLAHADPTAAVRVVSDVGGGPLVSVSHTGVEVDTESLRLRRAWFTRDVLDLWVDY